MEFLSSCWRPQGEETVSLLLQQYQYRHGQTLFACLCGGGKNDGRAGGYMTERCLAWFRGLNLKKLLKNREKGIEGISEELIEIVDMTDREMADGGITEGEKISFAGFFGMEDHYILIHRGAAGIYLLNTAFGKAYLRRLEGNREIEGMYEGQGNLQPDIGLLIATEGFYGHITEAMIKESLHVREITSEKQMERHLMELGKESGRLGGSGIGAIMIQTME